MQAIRDSVRRRIVVIYSFLIAFLSAFSVAVRARALVALRGQPVLLGIAVVAYGVRLRLRHAVDPDHIAAIDNVTRKLMRAPAVGR